MKAFLEFFFLITTLFVEGTGTSTTSTNNSGNNIVEDCVPALEHGYSWSGIDYNGEEVSGYVVDIYLIAPQSTVHLLNVFNFNDINLEDSPEYFQGLTGPTWIPSGVATDNIFYTDALSAFDSFFSISDTGEINGPPVQVYKGSPITADPNFGQGNSQTGSASSNSGIAAGWYNGNPTLEIGEPVQVNLGDFSTDKGLFIGRWAIRDSEGFSLIGSTGEIGFNEGLHTVAEFAVFTVSGSINICFGDLDRNGAVEVGDLLGLLGEWGICEENDTACYDACPHDLNNDEAVKVDDLLIVLSAWGDC